MITVLTGAMAQIDAAHQPEGGGPVHGHTWLVKAWKRHDGRDALLVRNELRLACAMLDHRLLPANLSRAEAIGAHLLSLLGDGWVEIEIGREGGLLARVKVE